MKEESKTLLKWPAISNAVELEIDQEQTVRLRLFCTGLENSRDRDSF